MAPAHGKILPEVRRFISACSLVMILEGVEIKCLNWHSPEFLNLRWNRESVEDAMKPMKKPFLPSFPK